MFTVCNLFGIYLFNEKLKEIDYLYNQVANFEYVDEVEAEADVEEPMAPTENTATVNISERAKFWEDLLRERYESQKIEEFNSMCIGKRSRKQVLFGILKFVPFDHNCLALSKNDFQG